MLQSPVGIPFLEFCHRKIQFIDVSYKLLCGCHQDEVFQISKLLNRLLNLIDSVPNF